MWLDLLADCSLLGCMVAALCVTYLVLGLLICFMSVLPFWLLFGSLHDVTSADGAYTSTRAFNIPLV